MFSQIIAGIILLLISPFLLFLVMILIIDDGFPIFFEQRRVGKNNSLFMIYKFRTMKIETPSSIATHLLDNPEIYNTKLGKYFRKFSLDELPQLYNIFRGDMVFIGPRPALYNQNDLIRLRTNYNLESMAPGITGWAQINGRDELSIIDKVSVSVSLIKISFSLSINEIKKSLLFNNSFSGAIIFIIIP